MSKLTIDQALQKGIESHKAGQLQEADHLYSAILKVQPKHPDANHNMGVLAAGVGKVEQALPFFKTALEANPAKAQYWLSYMDALIKLDRLADAKAVLDQAKRKGAKGDGFDKLEQRLANATDAALKIVTQVQKTQSKQPTVLKTPQFAIDPTKEQIQFLIKLYRGNKFQRARQEAATLLQKFPDSVTLLNIQASVFEKLGQLNEAIETYKKAISINPDSLGSHVNIGNALYRRGASTEAIKSFNKALAIKPDYAEVYHNIGNVYKDDGQEEKAIVAYNKALSIKPAAGTHNNLGNVLTKLGKLHEAMTSYKTAVALKPNYPEAIENINRLRVQLTPITSTFGHNFDEDVKDIESSILSRPKYQIQNLIKTFIEGDFCRAKAQYINYKAIDEKSLNMLDPKDKVFCNAYGNFIGNLLSADWNEKTDHKNTVYHLGESHCLSYAHRGIRIGHLDFQIAPRITFGGKAYHFSQKKNNDFKAITRAHFASLQSNSTIFISFGEIDCRPNEGLLSAATKCGKPLQDLIDQTVKGYVKWFSAENVERQNHLYFFNIPAPIYDKQYSETLNSKLAECVKLYNLTLQKYTQKYGFKIVDVYQLSVGKHGFSNKLYHIDQRHLGANALPIIEQQLA